MRAKQFTTEANFGTTPKRPARPGSRPDRNAKVDEIAGAFPSPSTREKWAKDAAASNAAEAKRLADKKAAADAERLRVNNAIVDKEQRINYHPMPDNEIPTKEGADERSQNALWAQITAHEKAANKSKDLKQQHHLKMADQLRSQLKTTDEGFDAAEFNRHMDKLRAREELRKTDPMRALVGDMIDKDNSARKPAKKQDDDSMSINDPRHPGWSYTEIGHHHNVDEGEVVKFPKKHKGDISNMHDCPKCGGDLQGGKYMGHQVQVCMPCKQVYLPPNSGIDQKGNKIDEVAMRMQGSSQSEKDATAREKARQAEEIAKHQAIVKAYVDIMSKGQPLPPRMQQSYNTMPDFKKEVDAALANIPGRPGEVDLEQRRNYHLIPKESMEEAMDRIGAALNEHKKGVIAKKYTKKPVNPSAVHTKAKEKLAPIKPMEEQFCGDCGGSLAEHGKASRALCTSSKPDKDLGASNLASCKSQGLRARDGEKSHKLGKSPKSRVTVGGHRIKGAKYGGPLPDWS